MRSRHIVFLSLFVCLLLTNVSAQVPTERLLVGNFGTATITIRSLNAPDYPPVGTVKVGTSPRSLAVLPGGRQAIVDDLNSQYMSLIDFTLGAEVTRIRGARGRLMAITSDSKLVVGVLNETVSVMDTSSLQVRTVSLNGKLGDDPLTADVVDGKIVTLGHRAYMNPNGPWPVTVIDLDSLQVSTIASTNVGNGPRQQSMALTPDGSKLFVLRTGALPDAQHRMLVIDTATNTVTATFDPGPGSNGIAVSRNAAQGVWGYVVQNNPAGGSFRFLRVLDLNGNSPVIGPGFPLPVTNVIDMDFTADGSRLFLGSGTPTLAVVDTAVLRSGVGNPILANLDVGPSPSAMYIAKVQTQPLATAPVVTGISPKVVVSDATRTITITGSHFAHDAVVRVGTLDPLTPTQATASRLQVKLPATSAAQAAADIIVSNPNPFRPLAEQHQSGILRGKFTIYASPQYQPTQQVLVSNFGESTVTQLHAGAAATTSFQTSGDWPEAIGFSFDANRAYIVGLNLPGVDVIDIAGNAVLPSIPLPGTPGQGTAIAMSRHPLTGQPVAYVGSYFFDNQGFADEQLQIIDADPTSAAYNTVIDTIRGGLPDANSFRGGLAVTPDGRYVYYQAGFYQPGVNDPTYTLMVFDVVNHTSSTIPLSLLGNPDWIPNLRITADGRYMVTLADSDKALAVLNLAADPLSPARVATITPTPPPGATVIYLGALDLVGNRLFVVDSETHVAYVFNFDPVHSNFAQLGSFTFPAALLMSIDTITASPDGKLLYVPLADEDGVAVLDTAGIVAGVPGALLTKIRTGVSAYFAGLRPGTPTPVGTHVAVLPMQGVTATFDNVTTAGATTAATTNTHPLATPAGFQVSNPPLFYRLGTTAGASGDAEVCFTYNPGWFTGGAVRALHAESSTFVDRTVSLDAGNHVVCAQASNLGSFVLGVGSADFLFDGLLQAITTEVTPPVLRTALRAEVLAARVLVNRGRKGAAAIAISAFKSEVRALSGKRITEDVAAHLISFADAILAEL
jgi:hypothetical protein